MTARELYERSPEMRSFVAEWVNEKMCPLPFADFLEEQGLTKPSEAVKWWYGVISSGRMTTIKESVTTVLNFLDTFCGFIGESREVTPGEPEGGGEVS